MLLNADGFDRYGSQSDLVLRSAQVLDPTDALVWSLPSGSVSIISPGHNSYGSAVHFGSGAVSGADIKMNGVFTVSNGTQFIGVGLALLDNNGGTSDIKISLVDFTAGAAGVGITQATIDFGNSNGSIGIYNAAGTLIYTSAAGVVPRAGVPFYFEAKLFVDGTTGNLYLQVNGVPVASILNANFQGGSNFNWNGVRFEMPATSGSVVQSGVTIDNFYLADTNPAPIGGFDQSSFFGPVEIQLLLPSADTATIGWTPHTGTNAQEMAFKDFSGASGYISATTSPANTFTDQYYFTHGNSLVNGLLGIVVSSVFKITSGTGTIVLAYQGLVDGADTTLGTVSSVGSSYASSSIVLAFNEANDSAWGLDDINTMQIGPQLETNTGGDAYTLLSTSGTILPSSTPTNPTFDLSSNASTIQFNISLELLPGDWLYSCQYDFLDPGPNIVNGFQFNGTIPTDSTTLTVGGPLFNTGSMPPLNGATTLGLINVSGIFAIGPEADTGHYYVSGTVQSSSGTLVTIGEASGTWPTSYTEFSSVNISPIFFPGIYGPEGFVYGLEVSKISGGIIVDACQFSIEALTYAFNYGNGNGGEGVTYVPPVYPALKGITYDYVKRPIFSNDISQGASGAETVTEYWETPLWEWELAYDYLPDQPANGTTGNDFRTLVGFFLQQRAQALPFYYLDPDDNVIDNEGLGAGNGTNTIFQLTRAFGFGPYFGVEPIGGINNDFDNYIYLNGELADPSTYSINNNTPMNNYVQFNVAPGAGVVVTGTYHFYYYVRFATDQQDFNKFVQQMWDTKKFTLRSKRQA